jgi:hypothetical protein
MLDEGFFALLQRDRVDHALAATARASAAARTPGGRAEFEADFCANLIEQLGLDIHNCRYLMSLWQAARFGDVRTAHRRCQR